jgi:hypothetical protein
MKYRVIMKLVVCLSAVLGSCAGTGSANPDLIADADPIPLGAVSVSFDKFFSSGLTSKDVPLVFEPRTNMVYLQFTYETVTYRQFWNLSNRAAFRAALARYQNDFDARGLNLSGAKARRAYGKVKGKTEWGQLAFSINSRAYPTMEMGYQFKGNNPYFTVVQNAANDASADNTDRNRRSLRITAYFTRAQGAELARFFDQEYLLDRLDAENAAPYSEPVPDSYPPSSGPPAAEAQKLPAKRSEQ